MLILSKTSCKLSVVATVTCWPFTENIPALIAVEKAASPSTSDETSLVGFNRAPMLVVPWRTAVVASWVKLKAKLPSGAPVAAVAFTTASSPTEVKRLEKSAGSSSAFTRFCSTVSWVRNDP